MILLKLGAWFLLAALPGFTTSCSHAPREAKYHYSPFSRGNRCPSFNRTSGVLSVQKMRLRDGRCLISLNRADATGPVYRSYQVSSTGNFMIFNSLGSGAMHTQTGSRNYYFFPRMTQPVFFILPSGEVEVTTPARETIRFSPKSGRILSMTETRLAEDERVRGSNRGGVEVESYARGILLDSGWERGGMAQTNLSGRSTFVDPRGQKCSVRNGEIFHLRRGEAYLLLKTDLQVLQFLEKRCPNLELKELEKRVVK